ncbi:MAG TPA: hypothetical protein VFN49_07790 [Candidatus Aquilonibacter sp.]|nr:hypothetical protein [Candidatus Aquilonibacter sp.]
MDTQTRPIDLAAEALPRCFVLNERADVIMMCSAMPGQPIEPQFAPVGETLKLPSVLERAVDVLAQRCVLERTTSVTARFGDFSVKVQLLRGSGTTRRAVIVDRAA